eukprot:209466_1
MFANLFGTMSTEDSTKTTQTDTANSYEFEIQDVEGFKQSKNTQEIKSPFFQLHGFKWCLRIFPNGSTKAKEGNVNYFVWLRSLPPRYSKIAVNITLTFKELDVTASFPHQFTDKAVTRGWTTGTLKTADIQNLDRFTFGVEIIVHDIYGATGHLLSHLSDDAKVESDLPGLTHQSSALMIDKQTMQGSRLDTLTLRVEELQMKFESIQNAIDALNDKQDEEDDNINCVVNEIDIIKKHLGDELKYEMDPNQITKEQKDVVEWLKDDCGLDGYGMLFVKHGVDNMAICRLLKMEHLEQMGIAKIGHRVQIAHKIDVLRQKMSNT